MTDERLKHCCEVIAIIYTLDQGIKSLSKDAGCLYIEVPLKVRQEFLMFMKQLREQYQKEFDEL